MNPLLVRKQIKGCIFFRVCSIAISLPPSGICQIKSRELFTPALSFWSIQPTQAKSSSKGMVRRKTDHPENSCCPKVLLHPSCILPRQINSIFPIFNRKKKKRNFFVKQNKNFSPISIYPFDFL